MHHDKLTEWSHSHSFGQDKRRPGENRTLIVIAITGTMMIVEIVTGFLFGSIALLADGLHMASHAAALTINASAYIYARRYADDTSFTFGTGKVNALGGFTGAILLAGFALLMVWESFHRLIEPVEIIFNQAIFVAVFGLVVNGASVFILGAGGHHHHEHESGDHGNHQHHHDDHNLRSAYLHVLADALTSVLAIVALLAAKYLGYIWMDPLMGIVGAILVARWSWGLLKSTSVILLDRQGPEDILNRIRSCIEKDGDSRISDLHLWSIGPGIYSIIISVVAHEPKDVSEYKKRLPEDLSLEHISIEVNRCPGSRTEIQEAKYEDII
jgi:cation diffusion facilitator family transporter